jgi:hypothetical protein
MPINYWPNATEDELRACAEALQRRMAPGEVMFVTLPGGGQMQRSWQNTPQVKEVLRQILYAWHLLDPSIKNPYVQRIRRTLPNYVNA